VNPACTGRSRSPIQERCHSSPRGRPPPERLPEHSEAELISASTRRRPATSPSSSSTRRVHAHQRGPARRLLAVKIRRGSAPEQSTRGSRSAGRPISPTSRSAPSRARCGRLELARAGGTHLAARPSSATEQHRFRGDVHDIRKVKKLIELLEESASPRSRSRKARSPCASVGIRPACAHLCAPAPTRRLSRPGGGPVRARRPRPPRRAGRSGPSENAVTARWSHVLRGARPGRQAFVEIGSEVKPGDCCHHRSHEMMNPIESDKPAAWCRCW